jgi:hypothetical protein
MQYACTKREINTNIWFVNLMEKSHTLNPDADGRLILRWVLEE